MHKKNKKIKFGLNKRAKIRLLVTMALSQALTIPLNVSAQWTGIDAQHGQFTQQITGKHLDINVMTRHLIANAQSLSLASNESVNVNQLVGGAALFRSLENNASQILGSVSSNGSLFLINPNGVLFGQGAQVNVGSLVATSMNISNNDFLSGHYQLNANGSTGNITNQGVIKAADGGYIVLLGNAVNNSGTLTANNGSVVMASAQSAVLDFYGNGLVKANLSGDALNALVDQSGVIKADGGAVQLATNSRSSAVNISGLVQANSLIERDGVIRLEGGENAKVAVSGTLNAKGNQTGATGGNIEVTGEQVALLDNAVLDASGDAGGGQVLVGGDYQGKNTQVYNARTTYVDQSATITVDAIEHGNGGKAIVWSDQTTRYYGNISAKGGAQLGDGGFVEVSGKKNLGFNGMVDVSASNGEGGKVLLDPENIVLNNTTQPTPTNNPDGTPDIAFADAPAVGTTTIQIADVTGFSELFLQATNDITVASNITMATDNSIRLEANNNLTVNGEIRTRGTGNIDLKADADSSGAGDLLLNRRVFSRQGNISLSGSNVTSVGAGQVLTQGSIGQDSGSVTINASNTINLAGTIVTNGRNGSAGLAGSNAGNVTINAAGAVTTTNIAASGGRGGTGNTDGGNAGNISVASTGAGNINVGNLSARSGQARGAGVGGTTNSININNTSGNVDTKNLYVHGNTNGNGGAINVTATSGDINVTGNAYAQGGVTASGSTANGGAGGNINLNASGDVAVTSRVYAQGGGVGSGNTAAGGNGGNINVTGNNLTFNNVVYSYGANGRGLNQSGGDAGNVSLNATGAITTKNVYAYGGSGGTGAGSNAAGGNAGAISIASTGVGDISTNVVNARTGAARGTGLGGNTGSISISNTNGDIATRNLDTYGNLNGHGGNITVAANTGDVTVAGRVYAYGGTVNNGHTLAGRNSGNINISGVNRNITSRVNANGNTAKGTNQAGGNAGTVAITGTGTLNVADVYSRNGNATGTGTGGNIGGVILSGSAIIATKNVITSGGRNGDAGNINITTTIGDINVKAVTANGGSANANTMGNKAGNITINSAGALTTTNVYANGSSGNGVNQNGGSGAAIDLDAAGAVTTLAMNASGGTGGNGAGSNSNGGDAGSIDVRSSAAGDINLNNTVSMHSGFARGTGNGGMAGSINIKNDDGNITTRNIYAEGYNHGDGSNVTLDAQNAGDVIVNGTIRAYGDLNASSTRAGTAGGDITIKGINNTVTGAISVNGGRGRGANQNGGDAGDIDIDATGLVSMQAINATGGNAGSGAGSNANGGAAGAIAINSTGSGDITTANITARSGYARGSGTGVAGSVDIQNDNGALTTGNISTRGQRRGAGGDITAVTTGGNIDIGNVDARASNLPAANGGDVTLATTTGDATVADIQTGGRWLVYSGDPRNDTIGAFKSTADFKQYNTNYGGALLNPDNGFVYRVAPTITASLMGTANKVYDGNTAAAVGGLAVSQTGAIDGDVVNLSALTSATYDNKNVGTGKTVTSNALTVTGATNSTTQVYGYQVTSPGATGNVGTITQRAISITADAGQTKAAGSADPLPFSYSVGGLGLVGGDTLTGALGRAPGEAVGDYLINQNTLDAGANYSVTFVDSLFTITDAVVSNAAAKSSSPRNTAGLDALQTANKTEHENVIVVDTCLGEVEPKVRKLNTSIIYNSGVKLPIGVKPICI